MTTYQSANNVLLAIKRESTPGTAATASGATGMRCTDSPGLELARAQIISREKRDDGFMGMPRLAGKSVGGSYNKEVTIGGETDIILESIMRAAWAVAVTRTYDNSAGLTSLQATSTSQITQVGTTTLIGVVMVGDIIRLANSTPSANDNLNLRVTAVTATVITVAGTPLTAGAADIACTLTVLKKLKAGTTPVDYAHTVEQYDEENDLSEIFLGCAAVEVRISARPGQPATMMYRFVGMDRTPLTTGTSPWFSSPTFTTGDLCASDDCTIIYNGAVVATFNGFDLSFTITNKGEAVLGSFVPVKIFTNDCTIGATITGLVSDFADVTKFDAETEFDVSLLLEEKAAAPKPCLAFFLPRVKIGHISKQAIGGDGGKMQTLNILVGPKVAATGYDAGPITIHSSAA